MLVNKADWLDDLLVRLLECISAAEELTSPNVEDTLEVKVAIIGFAHHASSDDWTLSEYEFVKHALDKSQSLSRHARLFYALSLGYLLGMAYTKKVSTSEFLMWEYSIPGFIALKGSELE
jgi:hypothetical protein